MSSSNRKRFNRYVYTRFGINDIIKGIYNRDDDDDCEHCLQSDDLQSDESDCMDKTCDSKNCDNNSIEQCCDLCQEYDWRWIVVRTLGLNHDAPDDVILRELKHMKNRADKGQ